MNNRENPTGIVLQAVGTLHADAREDNAVYGESTSLRWFSHSRDGTLTLAEAHAQPGYLNQEMSNLKQLSILRTTGSETQHFIGSMRTRRFPCRLPTSSRPH